MPKEDTWPHAVVQQITVEGALNGGKPTEGRKLTNKSSYLHLRRMMDSTTRAVYSAAIQKSNMRG